MNQVFNLQGATGQFIQAVIRDDGTVNLTGQAPNKDALIDVLEDILEVLRDA